MEAIHNLNAVGGVVEATSYLLEERLRPFGRLRTTW
jgi:hypothetical protein